MTQPYRIRRAVLALLPCFFFTAVLLAADWPCWRGPARNGISGETGLNWSWGAEGPPVLWRSAVGTGFSSFAVAKGRAYTLGNAEDTDTVYCLEAETGRELWRHAYPCPLGPLSYEGGPSATPAVHEDRVYTLSKSGHVFCLDAATGAVLWSRTLPAPPQTKADYHVWWGFAGSPLILPEGLILAAGSAGMALDPLTGQTLWEGAPGRPGYSSPVPYQQGTLSAFAFAAGHDLVATESRSGRVLWRIPWRTTWDQNAPDLIIAAGRLFVSSGHGVGCGLFDLAADPPRELWRNRNLRNELGSSVFWQDHLYGYDFRQLRCLAWGTGEVVWNAEVTRLGTLILADQRLIAIEETGRLAVFEATPAGCRPVAQAQPLQGRCWSAPALADGRLFLRNAAGEAVCLSMRP